MGSYGLKISQPFYDATTAADANLIFSSSWPTLPIAAEATFTSNLYGGTSDFSDFNLSFTHGLGFVPFTIAWATPFSPQTSARYMIPADSNKVYLQPSTALLSIHVVCYNIDITKDVEYPYIKTTGAAALYDNDFGIKIPKSGKDIGSTDMRDFILHSRCQSPQILAIKTEKSAVDSTLGGGTRDILYTPPVNSPIWEFAFQGDSTGLYSPVYFYNQSYPRIFVNANTDGTFTYQLNFGPASSGYKASLIMLRDPLFAANNVLVTY